MMIETYFGDKKDAWAATDTVDDKGLRAATAGIGPDVHRLKKAAIGLVPALLIAWYFFPNRGLIGCTTFFYLLWVWTMYRTHKVIYRVLLNPKDNRWYVIGCVSLEQKVRTWIPCSNGFTSQIEATIEARRARDTHDR
jgi:hypothetical protein